MSKFDTFNVHQYNAHMNHEAEQSQYIVEYLSTRLQLAPEEQTLLQAFFSQPETSLQALYFVKTLFHESQILPSLLTQKEEIEKEIQESDEYMDGLSAEYQRISEEIRSLSQTQSSVPWKGEKLSESEVKERQGKIITLVNEQTGIAEEGYVSVQEKDGLTQRLNALSSEIQKYAKLRLLFLQQNQNPEDSIPLSGERRKEELELLLLLVPEEARESEDDDQEKAERPDSLLGQHLYDASEYQAQVFSTAAEGFEGMSGEEMPDDELVPVEQPAKDEGDRLYSPTFNSIQELIGETDISQEEFTEKYQKVIYSLRDSLKVLKKKSSAFAKKVEELRAGRVYGMTIVDFESMKYLDVAELRSIFRRATSVPSISRVLFVAYRTLYPQDQIYSWGFFDPLAERILNDEQVGEKLASEYRDLSELIVSWLVTQLEAQEEQGALVAPIAKDLAAEFQEIEPVNAVEEEDFEIPSPYSWMQVEEDNEDEGEDEGSEESNKEGWKFSYGDLASGLKEVLKNSKLDDEMYETLVKVTLRLAEESLDDRIETRGISFDGKQLHPRSMKMMYRGREDSHKENYSKYGVHPHGNFNKGFDRYWTRNDLILLEIIHEFSTNKSIPRKEVAFRKFLENVARFLPHESEE